VNPFSRGDHPRLAKTKRRNHRKMETRGDRKASLRKEIETLKAELAEREKTLPAHTIRPQQLQAIEDLEEKIRLLEKNIAGKPF
jgi:hypothetical protein